MATKRKLFRLSSVSDVHRDDMDSVKEARKIVNGYATRVLADAQKCWDDLYLFRQQRERCKRYTYGNQWGDLITDENGNKVTEEQYIISQGNVPLKNNLIRRLVRTVNGLWRGQKQEPTCSAVDRDEQSLGETMSIALQVNWRKNGLNKVYGRLLDEFLVSGLCATKEVVEWRNGIKDCFTTTPQPNYLFFNGGVSDFRLWDLNLIGELHDLQFNELCEKFATSPAEFGKLKDIYGKLRSDAYSMRNGDALNSTNRSLAKADFLYPSDLSKCRVIEVWTKERKPRLRVHDFLNGNYYVDEESSMSSIEEENRARIEDGLAQGMKEDDIPLLEAEWFVDSYWYYRYITPDNYILDEGESPYKHREHPYTLEIYPMIDGEAHSFVADVIDQQRYINRLITLNDWVVRSSAKGLVLFPEDAIPDGMTIEELRSEIAKPNGMLFYKAKLGQIPTQLSNNLTNIGIADLLSLQLSLMEDVSGVTGALQGKQSYSGISGSLFAQQQQTASNSMLDILDTFSSFVRDGALKKVYNIQNTYDSQRILSIAGRSAVVKYDPDKMEDVQFDLSIVDSQQTPTYRAVMNDYLLKFLETGQLNIRQILEVGNFPFADRLIEILDNQEQQIQQGQQPEPIPEEIKEQVRAQSNPQAVERLQKILGSDKNVYAAE